MNPWLFIGNIYKPVNDLAVSEGAVLNNFPGYLMTNDTGSSKWEFSFYNMEIRVTDTAGCKNLIVLNIYQNKNLISMLKLLHIMTVANPLFRINQLS